MIRILDLCKYYSMSLDDEIRENYINLLCYIPINISTSHCHNTSVLTRNDFTIFSSNARNNHIMTSSETMLSMNNFKAIMGYSLVGLEQGKNFSFKLIIQINFS